MRDSFLGVLHQAEQSFMTKGDTLLDLSSFRYVCLRELQANGWMIDPQPGVNLTLTEDRIQVFRADLARIDEILPPPLADVARTALAHSYQMVRYMIVHRYRIEIAGKPNDLALYGIGQAADSAFGQMLHPETTRPNRSQAKLEERNMHTSTDSDPSAFGKFAPVVIALREMKQNPLLYATQTAAAPRYSLLNLGGTPLPGSHRGMVCASEVERPGIPEHGYYAADARVLDE